jgi:uncharacterized LabA/DUF88 family protein
VLFSGNGDYSALVGAMQRHGVLVTVVSTISTQPPMIAHELRRQADVFLDIINLRHKIERDKTTQAVRERGPAAQPEWHGLLGLHAREDFTRAFRQSEAQ